jgi:hypothetical protein
LSRQATLDALYRVRLGIASKITFGVRKAKAGIGWAWVEKGI